VRQPPLLGPTAQPARRRIVAVVGDSCLEPAAMKPQRVTGDEVVKQKLAEQVGVKRSAQHSCCVCTFSGMQAIMTLSSRLDDEAGRRPLEQV
jgi:hypothetical protein